MKTLTLVLLITVAACNPTMRDGAAAQNALPACEWCGAEEAPEEMSWETSIAGPDEPGEPLVINGTVYEADGETPAPGVILYAYHTNTEGVYPKRGDETGNAQRHGYLRGWMKTNDEGRYRFTTIHPAAYPSGAERVHIHMTVKEPDEEEYWLDSIVFEGDPRLTERDRQGTGMVRLTRDEQGRWIGRRDIVLKP